MSSLRNVWMSLCSGYSENDQLQEQLWKEIETAYKAPGRYYHNLDHVAYMIDLIELHKEKFMDVDTALFAAFYHDIIYDVKLKNNEEKSAELAVERMHQLQVSKEKIDLCDRMIKATKQHEFSDTSDINLFLDIDMAVLGEDWEKYEQYYKDVRMEYKIYPDLLYKPGRRAVLKQFLDATSIFHSTIFKNTFEEKARQNITRELELL